MIVDEKRTRLYSKKTILDAMEFRFVLRKYKVAVDIQRNDFFLCDTSPKKIIQFNGLKYKSDYLTIHYRLDIWSK